MNRWNIPRDLDAEIRERDTACIYCGAIFGSISGHGSRASWEHIINGAKIIPRENIAFCCRWYNSSKARGWQTGLIPRIVRVAG
jgi:hypothetical protein